MRPAASSLLAFLIATVSAWPAAGQDMAAAAAREKERREKAGKKAQAFTNDDLPKAPPKASPAPAGTPDGRPMDEERLRRLSGGGSAATAPSSGTAPEAKGEGEGEGSGDDRSSASEGKDEASWRRRGEAARDAVSRAEADVVRIQKALDDVRRGQTQPLPIDAMRQVPPNPLTPPPDADRLTGELEAAKAAVVAAKQALADLEEEARKAGVPPGWLR